MAGDITSSSAVWNASVKAASALSSATIPPRISSSRTISLRSISAAFAPRSTSASRSSNRVANRRRGPRGGLQVVQPPERGARRLPPGEVAIGVGRRLVAQHLGFLQGDVDLGEPGLALIQDRGQPAAAADDQRDDRGSQGDRQPTSSPVLGGAGHRRRRELVGEPATLGLLLGSGLGLDPGKLGGAEPLLHADPVGADPPRHDLAIARPV